MWLKAWVVSRSWAQRAAGDWNRMQTVGVGLPWTDEVLDPLYREYRELEPRAKHKDRPWRGSSVFEIGTKKLCWSLSWKKAGHVPHAMDEKKHKRNLNPNPTPLAGVGLKSQHQCGMGIPSTEINVKTRGKVGNPSDPSKDEQTFPQRGHPGRHAQLPREGVWNNNVFRHTDWNGVHLSQMHFSKKKNEPRKKAWVIRKNSEKNTGQD